MSKHDSPTPPPAAPRFPDRPPEPDPVRVAQDLCSQVDYALRWLTLAQIIEIVSDRIEGTIDGESVRQTVSDNIKANVLPHLDDAKDQAAKYAPRNRSLLAGAR